MKIIDLSQTLENGMSVYPGAPEPKFEILGSVSDGDIYQLTKFEMTTHTGTHLDCNTHVQPDGFLTETEELDIFIGKGKAIDCTRYKKGEEMGMEMFEDIELEGIEYFLFHCGWDKYWGQEEFWGDFPYLSMEVVEFLADNKTIKGIGFEYASMDRIKDVELPLHKRFMKEKKVVLECLTNLDKLIGKNFTFMAMPLKLKNGEGSPTRPIAIIE